MTFARDQKPAPQHQSTSSHQLETMVEQKNPGTGKLHNKVALIVGGDSGLGRAVAIAFAHEGANMAIIYGNASESAEETKKLVEQQGHSCLLITGDVSNETFCQQAVQQTIDQFGKIDILVNNAAEQLLRQSDETISTQELEDTIEGSLCSMFYMTNAALPYLKEGSTIINTSSIAANKTNEQPLNYTSTKGAIVTFTRSLSQSLQDQGIRVNGVAPGPLWTMLVPSNLPADQVKAMGEQMPLNKEGNSEEIAQSILYLASEKTPYLAGQVLFTQGMPC
jgi:NAD(P)-dependent dehydrogenase (short-subunit alcohol dehydrogenase family)